MHLNAGRAARLARSGQSSDAIRTIFWPKIASRAAAIVVHARALPLALRVLWR